MLLPFISNSSIFNIMLIAFGVIGGEWDKKIALEHPMTIRAKGIKSIHEKRPSSHEGIMLKCI
jgi:hypothetical protein